MKSGDALSEALAILQTDVPAAFYAILDALDGMVVQCRVDRDDFTVTSAETLAVRHGRARRADVQAVCSHGAIVDLVDGRTTLLDAVLARRLAITADVRLMVRLSRAQRAFSEGAARSRRMRDLMEAYRRQGATQVEPFGREQPRG